MKRDMKMNGMKRFSRTVLSMALVLMMVVALFTGCSPETPADTRGMLSVDINRNITRSANPEISMDVSNFLISFTPLSGQAAKDSIYVKPDVSHIDELIDAGSWKIRCEAINYNNDVLGAEEKTVVIEAGKTAYLRFLIHENEGNGFFSVEFQSEFEGWNYRILDLAGKPVYEIPVELSVEGRNMVRSIELPKGEYQTELISPEGEVLWYDSIRIAVGHGSAGKYTIGTPYGGIDGYDLKFIGSGDGYSGSRDPLPLEIDFGKRVHIGKAATFSLKVTDKAPLKVEWYVDGVYQAGQNGISIELTFPAGKHTVSAVTTYDIGWNTESKVVIEPVGCSVLRVGVEQQYTSDIDWKALEKSFETADPGIDLVIDRRLNGLDTWKTELAAGNGPDIIVVAGNAGMDALVEEGKVRVLSADLLSQRLWDSPSLMLSDSVVAVEGAHAIPFLRHMDNAIFYNRDLFRKASDDSYKVVELPVYRFFTEPIRLEGKEYLTYHQNQDIDGLLTAIAMNIYGSFDMKRIYDYDPIWNQVGMSYIENLRDTRPSTYVTPSDRLDAFKRGEYIFIVGSSDMMEDSTGFNWGSMPYCGKNADYVDVPLYITADDASVLDAEEFILWLYSDDGIKAIEGSDRFSYLRTKRFRSALEGTDILPSGIGGVEIEKLVDFPEYLFNPEASDYGNFSLENRNQLKDLVDGKITAQAWVDDMVHRAKAMQDSMVVFEITLKNTNPSDYLEASVYYSQDFTYEWFIDDVKLEGKTEYYIKEVSIKDLAVADHALKVVATDGRGVKHTATAVFSKVPFMYIHAANYGAGNEFTVYGADFGVGNQVEWSWYISSYGGEAQLIPGENKSKLVLQDVNRADPLITVTAKARYNGKDYTVSHEYLDIGDLGIKGVARPSEGSAELSIRGNLADKHSSDIRFDWTVNKKKDGTTIETVTYSGLNASIPITEAVGTLEIRLEISIERDGKTFTREYKQNVSVSEYEIYIYDSISDTQWDVPFSIYLTDFDAKRIKNPVWTLDGSEDVSSSYKNGCLTIKPHAGRHTLTMTATGPYGESIRSNEVSFLRTEAYTILTNFSDPMDPKVSVKIFNDPDVAPIPEESISYSWTIERMGKNGYEVSQTSTEKTVKIEPKLGVSAQYQIKVTASTTAPDRVLSANCSIHEFIPFNTRIEGIERFEIPAGTTQQRRIKLLSTYMDNGEEMPYIDFTYCPFSWSIDGMKLTDVTGPEITIDVDDTRTGDSICAGESNGFSDVTGYFDIVPINTELVVLGADGNMAGDVIYGQDAVEFSLVEGPTKKLKTEVHLVAGSNDRIISNTLDDFAFIFDEITDGAGSYSFYVRIWNGEYWFESNHASVTVIEDLSGRADIRINNMIKPLNGGDTWLTPDHYAIDAKSGKNSIPRITVTDIASIVPIEGLSARKEYTFTVTAFNSSNAPIGCVEVVGRAGDLLVADVSESVGKGSVDLLITDLSETTKPIVTCGTPVEMTWNGTAWAGSIADVASGKAEIKVEVEGKVRTYPVRVVAGRKTDASLTIKEGSVTVNVSNNIKVTPKIVIEEVQPLNGRAVTLKARVEGYDGPVDFTWSLLGNVKNGNETSWEIPEPNKGYFYIDVIACCGDLNVSGSYEVHIL